MLFQCDNQSVVLAVQKGSTKDPIAMHLLRALWFFVAFFDIDLIIEHIAGVTNCAADMLSRNNMTEFLLSHPQASQLPTPLPPPLLQILTPMGPDWTSLAFSRLFRDTISMVRHHLPETSTSQVNADSRNSVPV